MLVQHGRAGPALRVCAELDASGWQRVGIDFRTPLDPNNTPGFIE